MGRTNDGLPPRSKSEREFDHEIGNIVFVLNAIDAGRLDHLFVDAENKAAVRADWMAKGEAVVRKYARRIPGCSMRRSRAGQGRGSRCDRGARVVMKAWNGISAPRSSIKVAPRWPIRRPATNAGS
jgi:hypothetical protein